MKVALVTGGNKDIGYELCRDLVQAGHVALLAARSEKAHSLLRSELWQP